MAQSRIIVRRKKRGRPPTGNTLKLVNFRMSDAEIAAVVRWAKQQADKPGRSVALRRLVQRGLEGKP